MNSASNTSSAGADILISNLFQTMVHDLKSSSSAWDNVCQKATKLSSQLLSTVHCLSNFVDAVQVISDNANNIKGASRDIGAALTRFCLRQKSLENLIRSLATALTDQFVVCLEKKSVEWKQRVGEIERRRMRSLKSRSRQQHKKGADQLSNGVETGAMDSNNSYTELLFEQRRQFVFFVNILLPVMNIQVELLEEGTHVKQVRDSIQATANEGDAPAIILALLEDLGVHQPIHPQSTGNTTSSNSNNNSASWHRRMISSSTSKSSGLNTPMVEEYCLEQQFSKQQEGSLSPTSSTLSNIWPSSTAYSSPQSTFQRRPVEQCVARPHTISAAGEGRRAVITSHTFMAPTTVSPPTSNGYGGQYAPGHGSPLNSPSGKPPLPRRQISVDSSNGSGNPGGSIYSPPSQRANHIPKTAVTNHHHPLSISANDLSSPQDSFVLRHDAAGGGRRHPATSRPVSLTGCSDLQQSQTNFLNPSGHCSTSLLAEALQQIDQLAVELDSGLNKIDATYGGEGIAGTSSRLPPSYLALGEGIVRYRPQHQMQHQDNSHRPPPPPQRRNSTITAATPTAPSIADLRGNTSVVSGFYQPMPQTNGCGPPSTRNIQYHRQEQPQPQSQQTSRYYPRV